MVGKTISHYQILEKLGEGGMGVVYKARDTELGRLVALKVLPADALGDEERKRRFLHEARAASALNDPNIVTIYEIGHAEGIDFLVMEYVEGRSLKERIAGGPVPVKEALNYARQIASALAAAHAAGIVHRDIKPANILITTSGHVKILDFGLAKLTERVGPDEATAAGTLATQSGMILGTVAYMSPEQAQGQTVDGRSDVFALGVVMYEMLSGRRPFQGDSNLSTMMAILRETPAALKEVPPEVERILWRALVKKRDERSTAAEFGRELEAYQVSLSSGFLRPVDLLARMKRPRVLAPVLAVVLALIAVAGWGLWRASRVRWAKTTAPEIARLAAKGEAFAAFDLAVEARRWAPEDPELVKLWPEVSRTPPVESDPAGADIYIREYDKPQQAWRLVGRSPFSGVAIPQAFLLWKLTKAGYETSYGAQPSWWPTLNFKLHPEGSVPAGMVAVSGTASLGATIAFIEQPTPPADQYFIDRYEVTNRQFKEFADKGGYQKREYWKHTFRKGDRTLTWEEAVVEFRDSTGRPGPATWEAGIYREGQDDFPVSGVSWYEAAAYAEFAGKSLPTVSHWYRAAEVRASAYIIPASNFGGAGPARVGQYQGVGPFGTYDMAGNVKEWCWNETSTGLRFILGGAWSDPVYQASDSDAQSPWDRRPSNGFRCARYTKPPGENLTRVLGRTFRDYSKEQPVSEEVFRAFRTIFAYDPKPLNARVEEVDDSSPYWRRERVSLDAAYGGERLPVFVFLPKAGRAPFQAAIFFPGAGAQSATYARLDSMFRIDFIIRGGRAAIYPVYQGTYYRKLPPVQTPLQRRERTVMLVQDLKRAVEYAATRSDLDANRLAYAGSSWGGGIAPLMLALEERLKAAVLFEGGLWAAKPLPEVDVFNYLPRVRVPVLMLNGRYDFSFPLETSQKPFFRWLGTPEKDKRHLVYDAAHDTSIHRTEVVREALNWLDKHLGPLK